jgi:hypothetical protein
MTVSPPSGETGAWRVGDRAAGVGMATGSGISLAKNAFNVNFDDINVDLGPIESLEFVPDLGLVVSVVSGIYIAVDWIVHHPQEAHFIQPVLIVATVLADHRVQPGHPRRAPFQPRPGQHPARSIHHLDVVIFLRPVISHEQLHRPLLPSTPDLGSPRENHQRPNKRVLTPPQGGHDIPAAIYSPGHRRGHDLGLGLPEGAQEPTVLTRRRLPEPSLPDGRPVSSY